MRKVKTFSFFDIVRGGKDLISIPMDQKCLYNIKISIDIHIMANQKIPEKATALL